jgi:hypothetical protein
MPVLRLCLPALAALALVAASPLAAAAQEAAPVTMPDPVMPRASDGKPATDRNVKVDVLVTIKGADKPVVKSLSMVAGDGRQAQGRGTVSLTVTGSRGIPSQRDVGINVDAAPRILASGKITVRLKLNFLTIYRVDTPEGPQPSFGNGIHEVEGIVFDSGKPIVVTQGSDAETGREYSVQVTATILK